MSAAGNTDGQLVKALKVLWRSLGIDESLTGGLWWNKTPENASGPYAVLVSDRNTRTIVTSDGAIYKWEFTINLFLARPDSQDAEEALSVLAESVDQIVGNRLTVGSSKTGEIRRQDDATFDTETETIVQNQLKYEVVH